MEPKRRHDQGDGEDYRVPATIDDAAVLDEIEAALQGIGHAGAG